MIEVKDIRKILVEFSNDVASYSCRIRKLRAPSLGPSIAKNVNRLNDTQLLRNFIYHIIAGRSMVKLIRNGRQNYRLKLAEFAKWQPKVHCSQAHSKISPTRGVGALKFGCRKFTNDQSKAGAVAKCFGGVHEFTGVGLTNKSHVPQ